MLKLRTTATMRDRMQRAVFRGDRREAVVLALCGRHRSFDGHVLTVKEVHEVADEYQTVRERDWLEWSTRAAIPLLRRARSEGLALLVLHSHPGGFLGFSAADDANDMRAFPQFYGWLERNEPLLSAVMVESGQMVARCVHPDGTFEMVDTIAVADHTLVVGGAALARVRLGPDVERTLRYLSEDAGRALHCLRFGIIGLSGNGTPTLELLLRVGARDFVLVDPGVLSEVNQNRCIGMGAADIGRSKVDVKREYAEGLGLGAKVLSVRADVLSRESVLALASCDVLFGCTDNVKSRIVMERLAAHYCSLYIDLGIGLRVGGEDRRPVAQAQVNVIRPDGDSLLLRKAVAFESLRAEELAENNPEEYSRQVDVGYLGDVRAVAPTVANINGSVAAQAVSELLGRLDPDYFEGDARAAARVILDVRARQMRTLGEREPCPLKAEYAGAGDATPLLGLPQLGDPVLPPAKYSA